MEKHEFYANPKFHHVEHPLVEHKLAILRDVKTNTKQFMELAEEIAMLVTYEATKDLPLEEVETIGATGTCKGYCKACFDGKYPTEIPKIQGKNKFDCKISEKGEND